MAWADVPAKLVEYDEQRYAKLGASATLLREYGATTPDQVPEYRREDFERDLDYRLGACKNLAKSGGKRMTL